MTDVPTNSEISVEKEMRRSYLDYAMSVIIGRALPDVRDGLKPVHRRILFAMRELRNFYNKSYKKSARVVGDVIGKYHPHGDSAVYSTMVRMAQNFSLRYPLVDGQGNFGSVDGDPPAAMRYTEVRMENLAQEMLEDLDKDTVTWTQNYDESMLEPVVFPTRFPALLVNGSSGIAVGMATNIPPHNLSEVIDGIKYLVDYPMAGCEELMQRIPGPDFPTAATVYGSAGIRQAYTTGRGILHVRAKIGIEEDKKIGRELLVITEIPYQVNKSRLIEAVAALMRSKQIDGISYIRDESDRSGMRIVIALKKDQVAGVMINQLYKHTQMESSFGIIFLAVVNNRPAVLNLKQILESFIDHRRHIIIRRTEFDLKKAKRRAHILEGLTVALDNLDEVVALVRQSKSPEKAKSKLIEKFKLTLLQAQAILDMRLHRLTGLEREKIILEYDSVLRELRHLEEILKSNKAVLNIIKSELDELQTKFGDKRRTDIVECTKELTVDDMIAKEDMVVTISNTGYIKRNPITLYHSQRRGGRGKTAMGTKDDDFVAHLFVSSTHHYFLFFTNMGKVYWCKVYDIPMAGRQSRGKAIVNLLNFIGGEKMTAVLAVPNFEPNMYVFMATRNGIVKKIELMAFSRPRSGGIIAIKLTNGDELIAVKLSDGLQEVFLGSATGKSIRFNESDVRSMGRTATGVRGMKLTEENSVIGMEVLSCGQTLFAVTENGFGKRTSVDEYPIQKRGGKGVITIKTSRRNGNVVGIVLAKDDDDLMLVTNSGKLIRIPVSSTSIISRNTQGVKLIVMEPDERVVGVVGLAKKEENLSVSTDEE